MEPQPTQSLSEHLERLYELGTYLLVDGPRKGLDMELLGRLCARVLNGIPVVKKAIARGDVTLDAKYTGPERRKRADPYVPQWEERRGR